MTDSIVGLMGATGAVRQQATQYSLIIFAGAPLFLLSFLINGALQALGNTTAFRNSVIGAVLLNIVLDPILMFGWLGLPALGWRGSLGRRSFRRAGFGLFAVGRFPHRHR